MFGPPRGRSLAQVRMVPALRISRAADVPGVDHSCLLRIDEAGQPHVAGQRPSQPDRPAQRRPKLALTAFEPARIRTKAEDPVGGRRGGRSRRGRSEARRRRSTPERARRTEAQRRGCLVFADSRSSPQAPCPRVENQNPCRPRPAVDTSPLRLTPTPTSPNIFEDATTWCRPNHAPPSLIISPTFAASPPTHRTPLGQRGGAPRPRRRSSRTPRPPSSDHYPATTSAPPTPCRFEGSSEFQRRTEVVQMFHRQLH